MSSWKRFQQLNGAIRRTTQAKVNNHFILKGYPSIDICRGSEKIPAVVVNAQLKEEAYIYTDFDTPLEIGSIWQAKGLTWMVVEEIVLIKNVDWHKYYCLLCNINSDVFNGLFIGPEKTHINLMLRKDVALISQQKPVLVVPGKPLDFQDKIMLGGRSFMVNEYDIVSTPGITYYSLMPTTMSKEMIEHHQGETVFIEKYNAPIMRVQDTPVVVGDSGVVQVSPNIPITVRTAEGHFNCSSDMVEVLEYKENEITFIVHFGVNNFSIETKGADNLVITTNYEVVL